LRTKERRFATAAGAFKAPLLAIGQTSSLARLGNDLNDLIFVGVLILFVLLSAAYVRFCDKL
jgi:hypothetical protein